MTKLEPLGTPEADAAVAGQEGAGEARRRAQEEREVEPGTSAHDLLTRIFLSLEDRRVTQQGVFVGLANFQALLSDGVFWQVTRNTIVYTIGA